jgi:peptidoglycan/xylan/chitin deacetylase (PgdA/CDA1 family)
MEKIAYYVIDNYNTEHIVLCLGMSELMEYSAETGDEKQQLHAKVAGEALLPFYTKFLLLSPEYGMEKLAALVSNSKKPQPTTADVFIPETGVYNKARRDGENSIVNIEDYVSTVGGGGYFEKPWSPQLVDPGLLVSAVKRIKEYCIANGVSFEMVSTPNYEYEVQIYDKRTMKEYWSRLAEVQDFWNFSGYSAVSRDPRFFYDTFHFRNIAGDMVLGRIFDDPSVWRPENFGLYFTGKDAAAMSDMLLDTPVESFGGKVQVPILMYHHIVGSAEETNYVRATVQAFEEQIAGLKDSGYSALFFQDLIDYVDGKRELPEKPVLITFDDGYLSNYELAFPILKKFGMKATISVIGWSAGRDSYQNGRPIIPHFDWVQAREMAESGLVDIQNHSYDMHETGEKGERKGVLREDGETTAGYARLLREDAGRTADEIEQHIGKRPTVFAYPFGFADLLSEEVLREAGYRVTLLTGNKISSITKGDPYSLYGLYRINVENEWTAEELLHRLQVDGMIL